VIARFTPDGKGIITGGRLDGILKIWDRASGIMLDALPGNGPYFENAVFSPDGSTLATTGGDGVKLWNWFRRTLIAPISGCGKAQGVAFSHDGTYLATAHEDDKKIRLWDVSSRQLRREFPGHLAGVFSVAFTPDDRTLVSADSDGVIRIWDAASGLQRGGHEGHSGRIWNLALSPDGLTIASAGGDGSVKLWEVEPRLDHVKLPTGPLMIGFSADDQSLLTLEHESGPQPEQDRYLCVGRWDPHAGTLLKRTHLDLLAGVISAIFSRDGRLLAIENNRHTIKVWNVATGHEVAASAPMSGQTLREFSPDNRHLLVGNPESWSILDIETGRRIPLPWSELLTAIFTPTGTLPAVQPDGSVSEWEPRTGRIKTFPTKDPHLWDRMAISPDGGTLTSIPLGSWVIRVLSTGTLEPKTELLGHPAGTVDLAFTPDGKTLGTCGAEGTIKLWDLATGEELLSLRGFSAMIPKLVFSPDGRALAALSVIPQGATNVLLWHAAQEEPDPAALGQGSSATPAY
jgi:WD40 repeat protein